LLYQKVILDTDARNEIDDQYAITYAVLSGSFDVRGFTAAHFGKKRSMEESYDEILLVLKLLGCERKYPVFRGAEKALANSKTPADSPAARFIIDEALNSSEGYLYVICIAAISNLASAYLMEPKIKDRIKVIWLADKSWPKGGLFFNMKKDIVAAQIIFDSEIDLTIIPALGTANKLKIYKGDRNSIEGKGEIGDYLWKLFMKRLWKPKAVYDVVAIAALKSMSWCTWITAPRPRLLRNGKFDHSNTKGKITVITDIDAALIKKDFLNSLDRIGQGAILRRGATYFL
jgi:purine nucleosidase